MNQFLLCQRFGWTYQQLLDTPARVVNDFMTIIKAEAELSGH